MRTPLLALAVTLAPSLAAAPQEANERSAELELYLERVEQHGFAGAALVQRGDEVLVARGCGLADRESGRKNDAETIFDVGSVTKQFTATAILLLEQRGRLSLDDSIAAHLPRVPADKQPITLHHLLTHTSGIPTRVPVGSATTDRGVLIERALAAELASEPGAEYAYNNVGYLLLGAIVELVTEQRFEDFMQTELFGPAGLTSTSFLHEDDVATERTAIGYEGEKVHGPAQLGWYSWGLRGAGGVLSTVGDMARWCRAMDGDTLLGPEARERQVEPHLSTYACGWMVRDDDPNFGRVIEHGGTTRGFEAHVARYPDLDLVVVVLANDRGQCKSIAWNLAKAAAGRPYGLPEEVRAVDPEVLAACVGTWTAKDFGVIEVRAVPGGLALVPDAQASIALTLHPARAKTKKDKAADGRARAIAKALVKGDAAALAPLVSPKYPNWNHTLVRTFRGWTESYGAVQGHEVLGSSKANGIARTFVAFDLGDRALTLGLSWDTERCSGYVLNGSLPPELVFRPASDAGVFVGEEPGSFTSRKTVLRFEGEGRKRTLRIDLAAGETEAHVVELKRKR